ncbi:putative ORFan [Tupanvirus deep ocean]|uniref:ORFan n=2 Tax=Tupanvirus TaxID=2094720 RepID=A0AC62A824_9VIRU|nr:putative ORFan [Tupanvirus deep ocean]QKU33941.1 putative ORFan [Tupanvirus deep ocean]
MDFNITNKDINDSDIYDADISSNEDENVRIIELNNMENTVWFKSISLYPVNLSEIGYFIDLMDVIDVFGNDLCTDDLINYTPKRLDALFFILKFINLETVKFCEHVIGKYFEKQFNILFFDNIMPTTKYNDIKTIDAFLDEFYMDISQPAIRFLKNIINSKILETNVSLDTNNNIVITEDFLCDTTKKITRTCHRLLNSEYYDEILKEFDITFKRSFFVTHFDIFKNITKQMIEYTYLNMIPTINIIKTTVSILLDDKTTETDLVAHLESNFNINEILETESDAINSFTQLMMDNLSPEEIDKILPIKLYEYDNFLYSFEHKQKSKQFAFWLAQNTKTTTASNNFNAYWYEYNESKKEDAKLKIDKMGYKLYPEKGLNNILTPFVMHNFVKSTQDLVKLIVSFMETSKNDPGTFNKYDAIDLESAFMLVAMSNEINKTYNEFLTTMKEKYILPGEYPIEFILRLVSRIFNVVIHFYDENIIFTEFDNTLYQMHNQPITIFQLSLMDYYMLLPKEEEFIPICNNDHNKNNNQNQISVTNNKTVIKKKKIIEI